jgi:hypothetical protein
MKRRLLFEAAFFLKQWGIGAILRKRMVVLALIGLSTYGTGAVLDAGKDDWVSLFNGKNLDGWVVKSTRADHGKNFWKVEDDAIICDSIGDRTHGYIWLMTEKEYVNFELQLKFQAYRDSPGSSGVQVRSRYDDGPDAPRCGWMHGPQVDVYATRPWQTGLIYDETWEERRWISPNLKDWNINESYAPERWQFKYADEGDGWNELHIICKGMRIKTILNGMVMTDFDGAGVLDNEKHRAHNVGMKGHIALQLHDGHELRIRFKDIRLRELEGQ